MPRAIVRQPSTRLIARKHFIAGPVWRVWRRASSVEHDDRQLFYIALLAFQQIGLEHVGYQPPVHYWQQCHRPHSAGFNHDHLSPTREIRDAVQAGFSYITKKQGINGFNTSIVVDGSNSDAKFGSGPR